MYATDLPFREYSDLHGNSLDDGYIYFGQPNQNPETAPVTVYWDAAGTQPALQPIRTTNGLVIHNGAIANLFAVSNYSMTVRDRNGALVFYAATADRVSLSAALADQADTANGATLIGYLGGTLRAFLDKFITSVGASMIGWIQSGPGAVTRLVQDKLRDTISVKDFGAVGDGVTDDTAAIAACIAAVANIGMYGGGAKILFPKGTYLCHIALQGSLNNTLGEYGICLSGYGATLKGRASDSSIIQGNSAVATTADPLPGGDIYVNGTTIEGFTLDMSLMTNSASNYAIAMQHAYNSSLRDVHVIGEPALGGGLFLGSQCYTWSVNNLNCNRVQVKGYNSTTNMNSSMTFTNLVCYQVLLTNLFAMSFSGGAIQGNQDHFVYNNAQAITITGMDFEGPNTGECVHNFTGGAKHITSIGNGIGGYSNLSYSKGVAINSNLADRPNLTGNTMGIYGRTNSQGLVTVNGSNVGLTNVSITGTAGQFSCNAASLAVGMGVRIDGTLGGTGSIAGYASQTTYYIIATNGSTNFTLSTTPNGVGVATTAGTPTGLSYLLYNAPTPIYYFTDVTAGNETAIFNVSGDNGFWGFGDLIMVAYGTVAILSTNTMYGSPPARVYGYSSVTKSLNFSIISQTANVRCVAVEYLS